MYYLDPDMCMAALTPLAEKQQYAVTWQREYFQTFGQHIPNADSEVLINYYKIYHVF